MALPLAQHHGKRYRLGDSVLDPDTRIIRRDGEIIHLANKPFHVLLYLIEHRDRVVSRMELLGRFWDGKDVYDDTLRKSIGTIRKALGERADATRFIETRHREGYRYVGPCEEEFVESAPSVLEIEKTRGVRIVVVEEETPSPDRQPAAIAQPEPGLMPAQSRSNTALGLASIALAVVLATLAVIMYRGTGGRRSSTGAASPIRSVAVLPLKNLSGDPNSEYFADGLTESFITELSKVSGLKVISRSSVFTFKGKEVDPREAGRQLGVAAILEGSVRRSGDQVRVDVRLVSTADGEVLWAGDAHEQSIKDIFVVQDEIARNVSTGLRIKLSGGEPQRARRYTDNVEAYEAYLKGRYFLSQRTAQGITRGIEFFKRATALDPNYALAYAGLTESYDKAYWFLHLPSQEVTLKEQETATKALALDDSLAEAHLAMASAYGYNWDLSNALREVERAVALNPGDAAVHHHYAYSLLQLGRFDEAVAEIKLARELDPLNIVMNVDVGEILLYARRYDEAIESLKQAIGMDPSRANAHFDLAQAYAQKGMEREAIHEYLEEESLAGISHEAIAWLKETYTIAGVKGFWQARLRMEKEKSKHGFIEPYIMAQLYARLGETDLAFDWLERAYAEHSASLLNLQIDPILATLRPAARFTDLLRRVGFAQ